MTDFDQALRLLQKLCAEYNFERVDVLVRQDGRVTFSFCTTHGYVDTQVQADLDTHSEIAAPNHALHTRFAEWGGL